MPDYTIIIHALHYAIGKKPVCRLYHDLVGALTNSGFKVVVITAKNGQSVSSLYGERLITVNNVAGLGESIPSRILDHLSFFFYSFRIMSKLSKGSKNINLIKSGYGISAFLSMLSRKMQNQLILFWVLDRYPDIFFQSGKPNNVWFKILKRIQVYSLNQFNKIVFETKNDLKDYLDHGGITNSQVINTWSENNIEKVLKAKPRFWDKYELDTKRVVTYSGNIANSFDIIKLKSLVLNNPELFFVILGSGTNFDNLTSRCINWKLPNLFVSAQLIESEYFYVISHSSYGLIILKDGIDVFSSKLTTYLAFNKPIIAAIDDKNVMSELIKDNSIGMIINDKHFTIDSSLSRYKIMLGNIEAVKKEYSMDFNTKRFIRYIQDEL